MKSLYLTLLILMPQMAFSIVDGEAVLEGAFNQSVALTFKRDPSRSGAEIYCSGTLIGPRTVITVGHCFLSGAKAMRVSLETFQKQTWIYIGGTNNAFDLPMIIPQLKTKKVILHPQNDLFSSDLALIELSEDVDLIKYKIRPASLLIPDKSFVGKELIHVGYGQITNNGVKGNKALMRSPLLKFTPFDGLGVGEMYEAGPSACHGDSGGSAYMSDANGMMKFIGVEYAVSNHPCGESATYFIPLTNKVIDWVKATIPGKLF